MAIGSSTNPNFNIQAAADNQSLVYDSSQNAFVNANISVTGTVTGGVNVGSGKNLFKSLVGTDLSFRSLVAGTGVTLTENATDITLSATGTVTTAGNLGSGKNVFAQIASGNLQLRSLTVGTGLTTSNTATEINIAVDTANLNAGTLGGNAASVFLTKADNLASIGSLATARTNLDVFSKSEANTAFQRNDTDYLPDADNTRSIGSNSNRFSDMFAVEFHGLATQSGTTNSITNHNLGGLANVDEAGISNGKLLQYNGTKWVGVTLDADDLTEGSSNLYFTNARADARAQLKIDALIGGAPGALDTLNELAAAINDNASYASSITTSLAGKEPVITAGTTAQYYRGDKSFQTLNTDVVPEGSTNKYINTSSINALTDVNTTGGNTPTDGQVLTWDTVSSYWKPATVSGGGGGAGDITAVVAGTGLTGGASTGTATLNVDVGTTADKVVQLNGSAQLPAISGALLTNINTDNLTEGSSKLFYTDARFDSRLGTKTTANLTEGANLYYTNARADARITNAGSANWNTAFGWGDHGAAGYQTTSGLNASIDTHLNQSNPTSGYVLSWNGSDYAWVAQSGGGAGDITAVVAGTGLTGGAASGSATLNVDVGTGANKIVQLDGSAKLPAVDGSNLTNLPSGSTTFVALTDTPANFTGGANKFVKVNSAGNALEYVADPGYLTSVPAQSFASLTGKPTTIAGYGITDALALGTSATTALAGNTTFSFASLTGKPTTISGYGITDNTWANLSDKIGASGPLIIALGRNAGLTNQGTESVAIGSLAGKENQGAQTIAIGSEAGRDDQGANGIALGHEAGRADQADFGIAIGEKSGNSNQGIRGIAIGRSSGKTDQGTKAVAIGDAAGYATQGAGAIAIGDLAGETNQAANSIVINASGTALNNTTANSLRIKPIRNASGTHAVEYNPTTGEVTYNTLGGAGYSNSDVDAHLNQSNPTSGYVLSWNGSDYAWVNNAGYTNTDFDNRLATKTTANLTEGSNLYYTDARADGRITAAGSANWNTAYGWGNHAGAGYLTSVPAQTFASLTGKPTTIAGYGITDALALGTSATTALAGNTALFDGVFASLTSKPTTIAGYGITDNTWANLVNKDGASGPSKIALGENAGLTSQGTNAIAIGKDAGKTNQAVNATAFGGGAGLTDQGLRATALGTGSGYTRQGADAIAIGYTAGLTDQGAAAIAIGSYSAFANQAANSIILNATGGSVENTTASSLVIKPIRNASGTTYLQYNATTGEVTHVAVDTDSISEGSSNLYYTDARADARITNALIDEDNMASNSATKLPSQQSVKAYVDSQVASENEISEMNDVTLSGLATGEFLKWNGSAWINTSGLSIGDTDALSEGSSNLYYTNARADARITNAGVTGAKVTNWDTAYGWGNHASAGYLTSYTPGADSIKDTMIDFGTGANQVSTADIPEATNLYYTDARADARITNAGVTGAKVTNWDTAYGWGNHTGAGYLTSVPAQSFASLTGKPTTIAGYGITDALALGTSATTALAGNTSLFDNSAFDTRLASKNTANLTEGTNLYYTNARADARIAAATLTTLSDVDAVVAGDDGKVLYYDHSSTSFKWKVDAAGGGSISALSDTTISGASNGQVLKYNGSAWVNAADSGGPADTDALSEGSSNLYHTNARAISAIQGTNINMGSNNITTTGKVLYSNVYSALVDLPSASTYHGMFAHVHATGKGYFAHGGSWTELANHSQLSNSGNWDTAFGWGNHASAGYLTSTGVLSSHTDVNNASPTDGQVLTWDNGNSYWKPADAAGGEAFKTISVSGQTDVVADSSSDTLTLVAGSGIVLTTNAGSDSITVAASASGGGTDYEEFKINYATNGQLSTITNKSSGISGVSIDSAAGGDITVTFTGYTTPPLTFSMYGYNYAANEYNFSTVGSGSMTLKKVPGGGSSGSPTAFGSFATMKIRCAEAETGASRSFGTTTHAWVRFVMGA